MKHATHTMPDGKKMAGAKHKPEMDKRKKDTNKLKSQIKAAFKKEDDYLN